MKISKGSVISIASIVVGVISLTLNELQSDNDKQELHDSIKADVLAELRRESE